MPEVHGLEVHNILPSQEQHTSMGPPDRPHPEHPTQPITSLDLLIRHILRIKLRGHWRQLGQLTAQKIIER